MELNADFSKNVVIRPQDNDWVSSPVGGVERMMLDRIGDEVARATSIVRFAPDSRFSPHTHGGGEEFIVLDGVFSDEHGDFPAGSYIRNPPTSSHTPGSAPGCTIFVKLWQMQPEDRTHVRTATQRLGAVHDAARPGVQVSPLYRDGFEDVRMEHWAPGTEAKVIADGGAEVLVVAGKVTLDSAPCPAWTWIRRADGQDVTLVAGDAGAQLWIKTGHLRHVRAPAVTA
ncbi:cupin domain-containing protein [Thetidibacter halocola]|uniref:Cupin domain-containing protein n=1 Tax=Thetidibacter halocola TaxID=2827239 RepID=A0A8J8B6D4_9RHOB|nr:cupin domain-containing protein [Thetidibacter halocola]MBS0123901.1 cupin domain-containing protein [Thetidibacter halocola]